MRCEKSFGKSQLQLTKYTRCHFSSMVICTDMNHNANAKEPGVISGARTDTDWIVSARYRTRVVIAACFHRYLFVHGGGGVLPHCMLGYTPPRADTLWEQSPLGPEADTPPQQTPSMGADTPGSRNHLPQSRHPPCSVNAGRYGQQAGGMHPTGIHTSLSVIY